MPSDSIFGSFEDGDNIAALQIAAFKFLETHDLILGKGKQACRFVGSFNVQKVTGMLHVTALGHGYGGIHVDHSLMNFTHRIDRLSFGPLYPGLKNPLDHTLEVSSDPFGNFKYFLSIVPTIYVNHATLLLDSVLLTNQYSVTEHYKSLDPDHPETFPGIFIKYEIEPISVRITAKKMGWVQFLTRFCGIIGGVFVSVGYLVRIIKWIGRLFKKDYVAVKADDE